VETQNTIKAVAGLLGWKFSVVPYDNANPASMQQAFATALAKHPTVVAESGVAPSLFGNATIKAYAAAHIPIIVAAATPVTVTKTILGTATGASAVTAFHHAWIFMIACSLAAGALLQGVGNRVTEVADASVEAEPHAPVPAEPHAPVPDAVPDPRYRIAAGK